MNTLTLSCAILAGGLSSRFGADKTLAELNGKTLIKRVYDGVAPYSDDLMVIGKDTSKYAFLEGARHIADISEKSCSLIGLITALTYANNDKVFIISADSPLFPFSAIKMMSDAGEIVIPEVNGKLCTLSAIYPKSLLGTLTESFENGRYKISKALPRVGVTILPYSAFLPFDKYIGDTPAENGFININTADELLVAEKLLNREELGSDYK